MPQHLLHLRRSVNTVKLLDFLEKGRHATRGLSNNCQIENYQLMKKKLAILVVHCYLGKQGLKP